MNTAYAVLLVLFILYVPIYLWVWRRPEEAEKRHLCKYGPLIMIKTRLGIKTMDRLAKYHRFWLAFGFMSKLISAVLLFLIVYMLAVALVALPRMVGDSSIGIEYALAIPGFNPMLPLSYGIVALFIAMIVHEMGHGIQARTNGVPVKSTGLLYGVVPLGAFVEPDEDEIAKTERRVQTDVYAAGITVNTIMAVVCMGLMVFSCGFAAPQFEGQAGVYQVDAGSPIYESGIPVSSILTGVSEFGDDSTYQDLVGITTSVGVMYRAADGTGFDPTKLYTITYQTAGGERTTGSERGYQLGAFVKLVSVGSAAEKAGVVPGEFIYGLQLEGSEVVRISDQQGLSEFMSGTKGGDTVYVHTVPVAKAGETPTVTVSGPVVLKENNGIGFLGVSLTCGGATMVMPETILDRAVDPFAAADGSPISYVQSLFSYLSGPINGSDPVPESLHWWFDTPGGDLFWMVVTLLYWIFWLDLMLAISNALPAMPFDGGLIFIGGVDWLLEKLGIRDGERRKAVGDSICGCVSTLTLFVFGLVILAFII